MSENKLEFCFESPTAQADAAELEALLREQFPDGARSMSKRPVVAAAPGERNLETTLAIITLVLTVPGFINETLDLTRRARLKERMEALIMWAKRRRTAGKANPFIVLPPENKTIPLDEARPDKLLDSLSQPSTRTRTAQKGKA